MLLDSKVLCGAAATGRSSAKAFYRILRKAAVLVLAGDLFLKLVFAPSSDVPADALPRGELRRRPAGVGGV